MATFTMELREVIESLYGETMDEDDYIQAYEPMTFSNVTYGKLPVLPDYDKIGLAYYPIYREGYRKILNAKIIDEYYFQEIGVETIEQFVLVLRRKMDQIMPYFNKLYESELIKYDALDTMRIHSVGKNKIENEESVEAENTQDTDNKSGSRSIGSNFPQTMLAGNGDYASNGSDVNSTTEIDTVGTQKSESLSSTDSNTDNLVTGFQGAASDLITKYRNTLLNIDTMVLAEIEDCFMLVRNNGDEYFSHYPY